MAGTSIHRSSTWLVAWFLLSAVAHADLINVVNHSFEDITGETVFNEFTFGPLNGWGLYDPNNVTNGGAGPTFYIGTLQPTPPAFFTTGAPHGQRVGIAFNSAGSGNLGRYGMQQTLTSTLQANTNYQLRVEIGNIASGTALDNTFYNLNGFPGYRVELLAGGQVIAQDNNSLFGQIPEGGWGTSLINFTTGASHTNLGQALGIRLINLNQIDPSAPTAHLEVDFDNVRFESFAAVPEPGSLILATSILGLCAFLRWQRNTPSTKQHSRPAEPT